MPHRARARSAGNPARELRRAPRASGPAQFPEELEAVAFQLGGDEFLLLTFPCQRSDFSGLTPAEQEIASQLLSGRSYRQVARQRGSTYGTVANQIRSIFRKLQVHSRSELARAATESRRAGREMPANRGKCP
jgi:DNA-binding NarL/FixJ family response regulator